MIKDRAVVEAHLALLGWVPFGWCRGGAVRGDLVVWVNYEADFKGDRMGWTRRDAARGMFPTDAEGNEYQWTDDDDAFWILAKALTEDERFT